MSMPTDQPPIYQQINTNYAFAVYDDDHKLVYTKYNFNFDLYTSDHSTELSSLSTKSEVFYHFLINDNTDLYYPFSVRDDLKKYFFPINEEIVNYHEYYGYCTALNYMQSVSPVNAISADIILKNQFELIPYSDDSVRRLQDYIYYDSFLIFYTKYNFDFDTYKSDFNVWGNSKLSVFTDFVLRTQYLNYSVIGGYGYGKPIDSFVKYFIQTYDNLQQYLLTYCVTSIYKRVYNSFPNIIWEQYALDNPNLINLSVDQLQQQYISFGQFELLTITFYQNNNQEVNLKTRSLVTINSANKECTGFLVNGSTFRVVNDVIQVYIVTVYHVISSSVNRNTFFGTVNYFDENINQQITRKLAFKVIGYDIYSDVLVGLYAPELDYNKQFNSDLKVESLPTLEIDGMTYPLKNEEVFAIGNIGNDDTDIVIQGKLMNNKYRGNYSDTSIFGLPEPYLIDFYSEFGLSGSPVFKQDNPNCIGIIVGVIGNQSQYTIATSGYYLAAIVGNTIARWYQFGPLYELMDINTLNFFIKDSFPKKWLGIEFTYYKNNSVIPSQAFSNFNFQGGLIVTNFILGFNTLTQKFIVDTLSLNEYNVVPLNTPLLNTKMYDRFVFNNNVPIIIKSITAFENVESDYGNFVFGLKNNQYGFDTITYDLSQIDTLLNDIKYINRVKRVFPQLLITYFYYNGNTWEQDSEIVGGNTPDWYSEFVTDQGYLIYQHRFEFPLSLISYTQPYIYTLGTLNNMISATSSTSATSATGSTYSTVSTGAHATATAMYASAALATATAAALATATATHACATATGRKPLQGSTKIKPFDRSLIEVINNI